MAVVKKRAVTSGVLHGIEIAVDGGLITPAEVLGEDPSISDVIRRAREITDELVREAREGGMPRWRQVIIGEIVGMAVAARTMEGSMDDLMLQDLGESIVTLWRVIDRWVDGGPGIG